MPEIQSWVETCPTTSTLDAQARQRLAERCRPVSAPAGTHLFREGDPCEAYLIVLSGCIRVQKTGASGRQIVLYRVNSGETCIVTTACLMSGTDYDVEGIVEMDIVGQALPLSAFRQLLSESDSFRSFVFKAYGTRISTLLMRIEEVAFERIDARLARHLLDLGQANSDIAVTHQGLAHELGTAREVVSRTLKDFERRGLVRLGRNFVSLLQKKPLHALAAG